MNLPDQLLRSSTGAAVPSRRLGGWGLRWARLSAVAAASDPGLTRLRTASTTLLTLLVAAGVLVAAATLFGQPVTAALPGVVVAMIATIAVNDPTVRGRVVSTACLVPAAAVTAALSAALDPHPTASIVVFVAVAVAAVFAQRLGPRGIAVGMVGFIAYFLVLFLRLPATQIPAVVVAVALGAGVSLGMRTLLRLRHPDRELHRVLSALRVRAAAVVDALADAVRAGTWDARTAGRVRARLDRASQTALGIEDRLEAAEETVLASISNTALSVRVFDFQLGLELLTARVVPLVADARPAAVVRGEVVGHLEALRAALVGDDRRDPGRWLRLAQRVRDAHHASPTALELQTQPAVRPEDSGPARTVAGDTTTRQLDRLRHTLARLVDAWPRAVAPTERAPAGDTRQADTELGTDEDDDPDDDASGAGGDDVRENDDTSRGVPWSLTLRRAAQVAVATSLAIGVGELLSPTRWFWAVIAAFVVFVGASSRGQVLSKGWQRVIGTLAGVFAGVGVASLVGHNTVVAVALIALCLFLGLYLMAVASGLMMFFITTLLALVYGLLGQFSVDLLLLRLEETAAGALIGVAVSFLLLPSRTRPAVATAVADLLADLPVVLDDAATILSEPPDPTRSTEPGSAAPARALRQKYATLRTTAAPLTDGIAGVVGRTGFQRTLGVAGACEHHARALARLARHHAGVGAGPVTRDVLRHAATTVGARAEALSDALQGSTTGGRGPSAADDAATDHSLAARTAGSPDRALDALDDAAPRAGRADPTGASVLPRGASTNTVITLAAGHLRAIDRAVVELATHLGCPDAVAPPPAETGRSEGAVPSAWAGSGPSG